MTTFKALARIESGGWPLLVFPDDREPDGMINVWSPIDSHSTASPQYIRRKTRPATPVEAAAVKRRYETTYECSLILKKRLRA